MFPFRSKIDPFSAFTISLGPLYVERVFDSLLTKKGVKAVVLMQSAERYALYLDYLKTNIDVHNHTQYAVTQFYKGYFSQQLAAHCISQETARHFQEKALCYYQNYLELAEREGESRYYSQWQSALLQDLLGYPWPQVEESLLKAAAIDPLRGEAIKKLMDHAVRADDWQLAYSYSSRAVRDYYDKNPVAGRQWFVDFDAYNGKLLSTHLLICYKLGYLHDTGETFDPLKMVTYGNSKPEKVA
ncbi:MAG TPA: hypothetical protein VMH27_07895 [Puia sp.]|nr:hypothetical protein [Puia sp.]